MPKRYIVALIALAIAMSPVGASANGPTVTGAGSTWVQIALDQWRADIAHQGYNINYQGLGSSAGRQFFITNSADFAASEIPFQPDEVPQLQAEHKSYQYLPDVAGGTSLMYNLHAPSGQRITSLRMDAETAARIFTGVITSWQDPMIKALNPGLQVRESTIKPTIRSDGSGTSAQFSLYLQDQATGTWNAFVSSPYGQCPAPCSLWPQFPGSFQQARSDGVANFIASDTLGSGAIGYVESGYALQRGMPVASLRNATGNFTQPTAGNVSTALTHATLYADLTQNLTNVYRAPESNAYAMSSYSYLITPTAEGFGFDRGKGYVLGTWIIYIACGGQRKAAPLGYSPLPPNLIQADFDAVRRIPGAPNPPPIDSQHCPNPTVRNAPGSAPGPAQGPVIAGTGSTPASGDVGQLNGAPDAAGAPDFSDLASSSPETVVSGVRVRTLDDGERQALFTEAELIASRTPFLSMTPLLIAGGVVVLLVFGPGIAGGLFGRRRRRRPKRLGS